KEAGGQEEANGVMAVPPLGQCVLNAGEERVGARAEEGNRHRQIVDDVQHRDGDDEGKVEPVRHIDVWFLALQDRAEEDDEIGNPYNGQPDINVPFRLRIFTALGNAEEIPGCRHDDEELVAPEDEPGEVATEEASPARALDAVERCRNQRVTAERKNHRRGVQRSGAPKIEPRLDIEIRERELQRNNDAHQKADHRPEYGGNSTVPDRAVHIDRLVDG